MTGVTVLGSTGSIGISTMDVISRHPERFDVIALTANNDVSTMLSQCQQFHPRYVVMADSDAAQQLFSSLKQKGLDVEVLTGEEGFKKVVQLDEVRCVVAGIVGAAGLAPTLSAIRAGNRVLLANKEALVMAGQIMIDEALHCGAELLPIDSEHNAIFQCMPQSSEHSLEQLGITRILLTASGGPFRTLSPDQLSSVTPEQACNHPNWDMGKKISVDSATMMNKGLEIIEARWLFSAHPDQIQVVVHPQSVVHSMVQYTDGSVLAQLGHPDMRTPIAHALAWPERIESGVKSLDMFEVAKLDFEAPDFDRFPCLKLAYRALELGGTAATLLNAANELAVQSFLDGRLNFTGIAEVIKHVLDNASIEEAESLETIFRADRNARQMANEFVERNAVGRA